MKKAKKTICDGCFTVLVLVSAFFLNLLLDYWFDTITLLEVVLLMLDKPIPGYENEKFFFSLLATFGCAGTGGFGFIPGSMELFHPFSQYVMSIFLILFGCNFSLYYLMLIGKIKDVLRSEEFKSYFLIIATAVTFVFSSLIWRFESYPQIYTTEEAFRHSLFQVASLMTTAGYTTTDYHVWPMLATTTLVLVMFIGAMAGSTAGGIKVSRIVIAIKGAFINVRKLISPRYVAKRTLLPNLRNRCLANDSDSWALNQSGSPVFAGGHRGLCVGVSDFLRNGKVIPRKMVGLFQKVAQHKWTSLLVGGGCFWLVFRPANFDDSSSYLRVGRCSPHSI